jgi:acetyltransferase-like isoleucine patch superfamily enzyme
VTSSVIIGDHVHVGAGAIVLMGSRIGHHSVVGAGALVLQGSVVPPWSLVVGNPARVIPGAARKWADGRGRDGN